MVVGVKRLLGPYRALCARGSLVVVLSSGRGLGMSVAPVLYAVIIPGAGCSGADPFGQAEAAPFMVQRPTLILWCKTCTV